MTQKLLTNADEGRKNAAKRADEDFHNNFFLALHSFFSFLPLPERKVIELLIDNSFLSTTAASVGKLQLQLHRHTIRQMQNAALIRT